MATLKRSSWFQRFILWLISFEFPLRIDFLLRTILRACLIDLSTLSSRNKWEFLRVYLIFSHFKIWLWPFYLQFINDLYAMKLILGKLIGASNFKIRHFMPNKCHRLSLVVQKGVTPNLATFNQIFWKLI